MDMDADRSDCQLAPPDEAEVSALPGAAAVLALYSYPCIFLSSEFLKYLKEHTDGAKYQTLSNQQNSHLIWVDTRCSPCSTMLR